MSVLSVGNTFQ
ncbi:unnamed protein product [Staurois parvus]|uniref:Uncharacterized protein n=2 Tax=Staurois parvus TaxID=386267 RepID=A0ABN9C9N1_9NEOB|nr:unnamed protein product [Staurois parvus]